MEQISTFYTDTIEIAANQVRPSKTDQNYSFPEGTFSSNNVIVIPKIQTRNGGNTPNLRIWNVTATGFAYHIDEINGSKIVVTDENGENPQTFNSLSPDGNPWHNSETMGFIAFQC